jgi:mannitol/fructose-specific phosphotransferase system IIA component
MKKYILRKPIYAMMNTEVQIVTDHYIPYVVIKINISNNENVEIIAQLTDSFKKEYLVEVK